MRNHRNIVLLQEQEEIGESFYGNGKQEHVCESFSGNGKKHRIPER